MCWFYGWTLDDIEAQPYDMIWKAWYAMEGIHAENMLEMISVGCYADMKKESQKKLDKTYQRMAKAHRESQLKTMTPEELAYGIARKQLNG